MSRLIGAPIHDSVAIQSQAAQLFVLRPDQNCSTVQVFAISLAELSTITSAELAAIN